ncbi:MAG: hypothetical protein LIP11_19730, partial [Clostridiales bacterium]|nr:hypothetical protein [Clostridiales bacterium]
MKKRILSMVVIMSLIFSVFATSVLAADEPASADYTLRVAVADSTTVYNPGDTVTVEIYASAAAEAEVGSFQFTLDYDGGMLTFGSLAVPENLVPGASTIVAKNGATLSCIIGGSYTLTVSNSPVLIATATFTVNTGVATGDTATISLKSVEVNPSGGSNSGTVDVESATISFANIKVTFEAGSNTDMTSQTVYAKYNQMGLYSDETRTTALTADTISGWVSADTGYRLATEALWSDKTNAYTSASVLQQSFTSDVTLTAQAVQQFTVTFAAGTNGRLTGTTTLTVDTGTTLNEVDVPAPNPNTGYVFDGWDTDPVGATIIADITFTARFVDGTYNLTFPTVTGVTFAIGGTTTTQTTVTHSTDTTFTITASGVDVDAVYYSVAGSYPVLITADGNGNYTISGDVITGDVSITITSANKKNQTLTLNYDTLELPISASKDLSALNPVSGNETELAYGLAEGEGFTLDGSVLTTPETSDATATIVIYAKETEEYNASEPVAMTVKAVNKAEVSVTFENDSATYTGEPLTYEQASTEIEETDGSWAYDYYNANGVKLDSAPTDAGTYTVIATYTSSDSMGIATAYFTITKAAQSISYSKDSVSLHINDTDTAAFINDLTKATVDGDITYASNDTGVATVDENNGEVTIVGAGTATITATAAETANYNKATASYELTVKNHSYTLAITEPTCTEKGYTTYT